jgi:hypothetical protein
MRGLLRCVPFARECGDFCTVGDSVKCSDWVAPAVSLSEGLRLHRASLSLLTRPTASPFGPPNKTGVHLATRGCRRKKVSKERRALRAALYLIFAALISSFVVVMLARSRLATTFCFLATVGAVGAEGRWVGLALLARAGGSCFCEIGYSAFRQVANRKVALHVCSSSCHIGIPTLES